MENSHFAFLWTRLALDRLIATLDDGRSSQHCLLQLNEIPPALSEVFGQMLHSSSASDEDQLMTLKALQWAMFSTRILRLREWYVIMGLIQQEPFISLQEWSESPKCPTNDIELERQITRVSRGLIEVSRSADVEVDILNRDDMEDGASVEGGPGSMVSNVGETRAVYLIHSSVREFLLDTAFKSLDPSLRSEADVIASGHLTITLGCLDYICITELNPLEEARRKAVAQQQRSQNVQRRVAFHEDLPDEVERGRSLTTTANSRHRRGSSVASFYSAASSAHSSNGYQNHSADEQRTAPEDPPRRKELPSPGLVPHLPPFHPMDRVEQYLGGRTLDTDTSATPHHQSPGGTLVFPWESFSHDPLIPILPVSAYGLVKGPKAIWEGTPQPPQDAERRPASPSLSTASRVLRGGDVTALLDYSLFDIFMHANDYETFTSSRPGDLSGLLQNTWRRIRLLREDIEQDETMFAFAKKENLGRLAASVSRNFVTDLSAQPRFPRCKPCGRDFARPADLARHRLNLHDPRRKIQCSSCTGERRFTKAEALERHYRVMHADLDSRQRQKLVSIAQHRQRHTFIE